MDKNFLENFFHKFSKKVLDIGGEHVYNVPVATDKEERNKEKHKASESVKKSRTAKKK